jgi:hypothetical protein
MPTREPLGHVGWAAPSIQRMNEQEYASRPLPPTRTRKTKAPTLSKKIPRAREAESGGRVAADRAVAGGLVRLG